MNTLKPEPEFYKVGRIRKIILRDGESNDVVATIEYESEDDIDNAKRIIACVNACADMASPIKKREV